MALAYSPRPSGESGVSRGKRTTAEIAEERAELAEITDGWNRRRF